MNKVFSLLLATALLLGALTSCGKDDVGTSSGEDSKEMDIYNHIQGLENPEDYILIGNYKGVEVEEITVTDEDVEKYKVEIQNKHSYYEEDKSKTVVSKGDNVHISYISFLNGEKFEGGDGSGDLVVGDSTFIFPEVEQHLIGKNVGAMLSVAVVVPQDYFSKGLRGKKLDLNITIEKILKSSKTTPELNEEFIKKNFDLNSVEEFDKYIRDELNRQAEEQMMTAAWKAALDNCEIIQFPEGIVEAYVEEMYNHYSKEAAKYGADAELLIGDKDEWHKEAVEWAENYYKAELAMFSILDREFGREISDEEYNSRLKEYAEDLDTTADELEKSKGKEALITSFYWDKVMEVVWENRIVK